MHHHYRTHAGRHQLNRDLFTDPNFCAVKTKQRTRSRTPSPKRARKCLQPRRSAAPLRNGGRSSALLRTARPRRAAPSPPVRRPPRQARAGSTSFNIHPSTSPPTCQCLPQMRERWRPSSQVATPFKCLTASQAPCLHTAHPGASLLFILARGLCYVLCHGDSSASSWLLRCSLPPTVPGWPHSILMRQLSSLEVRRLSPIHLEQHLLQEGIALGRLLSTWPAARCYFEQNSSSPWLTSLPTAGDMNWEATRRMREISRLHRMSSPTNPPTALCASRQ